MPIAINSIRTIRWQLSRWENGEIDKYEFYYLTREHSPELVGAVAGIPVPVVKDRRRYLKQLATQS